jgi:hypothetical protein
MSSGNLVIDPTFIAPQDWYNGASSFPSTVTNGYSEAPHLFVAAFGALSVQLYPATGGEIVVGAGQIKVGDTLAYSAYMQSPSAVASGTPYFGLLDHNGTLLASAAPNAAGLCAGTYTVAAGVVSIRPIFSLNGVTLTLANPGRSAWAASHAYAVNAQVDPGNGWLYQCIVAGTSAGSAPTWPTPGVWLFGMNVPYLTVTDGGVTWSLVAWQGNAMVLSDPVIEVL